MTQTAQRRISIRQDVCEAINPVKSELIRQLAKLEALRKSDLSDGQIFNQQKYIDLRYGKSIFYQ